MNVIVDAPASSGSILTDVELYPLMPKNQAGSFDEKVDDVQTIKSENHLGPAPSPRKPASPSKSAKAFIHRVLLVDGILYTRLG